MGLSSGIHLPLEFCYLHQNRFRFHSLCYIDSIVFVAAAVDVLVAADLSAQDNHAVR
jgi:hypothetical protein